MGFRKQEDNLTLPYLYMLPEILGKQRNVILGALQHPNKTFR